MAFRKLYAPVEPDQSAVIPYRVRDGAVEVLLVTTRGRKRWIVPKGSIEEDEEPNASAEREAMEEAGVEGQVGAVSLGCYRHGRSKRSPIVEVFLMRVERELKTWPEVDERKRRWVSIEEAYGHVAEEGLRSLLDEAQAVLHSSTSTKRPTGGPHPAMPEEAAGDDQRR